MSVDGYFWPISGTLNELYAFTGYDWTNWLMYSVYQPLVSVNETQAFENGTVTFLPALAENWTVSPNGMIYTFNLRNNVHFSNGDPFNAYQVWAQMYAFYYLSANSSSWLFNYPVFNMSNVQFGPATINILNQSGVINPNAAGMALMQNKSWPIYVNSTYQIVFQLSGPFVYFPGTLVTHTGLMFDVQDVLDHGGFGTPTLINPYFNNNPIVGSGPYVVTQVQLNAYVDFAQDQNYWAKNWTSSQIAQIPIFDPGHYKTIIMYMKPDDLSRYTDLSTGAVQIADIQLSTWNLVANNPAYQYFSVPPAVGSLEILVMENHLYPTNITLVRQAIVHAINYSDLAAVGYDGNLAPFMGPEYPVFKAFYDLGNFAPYQYNLTLAEQDLAQAHVNVATFPTFSLNILTGCISCVNVAQVIQGDLAQIGINVQINVQNPTLYYSTYTGTYQEAVQDPIANGQLTLILGGNGWAPNLYTPLDAWVTFVSNTSLSGNWAGYNNPIVQNCISEFTSTTNISAVQAACEQAQQQIYNDAPYGWLGVIHPWLPAGGSIVWKTGAIKSFLVDPTFTGDLVEPILNTVIPG